MKEDVLHLAKNTLAEGETLTRNPEGDEEFPCARDSALNWAQKFSRNPALAPKL